jgi:tRNA dimethylallyltransferase
MLSNGTKIISIVGPTCTGKSALSLSLAGEFGGEIINADSMQVYRHFTIGAAKPDASALNEIPHHLIDIVEPGEDFNAAMFVERADHAIREVRGRGRTPILVGGTGLYLKALTYGLFKAPTEGALREELKRRYEKDPLAFYEELKNVDHAYAMRISFKDKVRSVRAMEVYRLTGTPMSELEKAHGFRDARYETLKIGLTGEREKLYGKIDARVEEMLANGWVEEVKAILSMGYKEASKPFGSIGYRDILLYIKGEIPYGDMVENIKKNTRHYAKRQFTWFAKEKDVNWMRYPEDMAAIRDKTAEFLGSWN